MWIEGQSKFWFESILASQEYLNPKFVLELKYSESKTTSINMMHFVKNSYLISDVQLHQETQLHHENTALSELVQVSHIELLELKIDTAIRNYFTGRNMVFNIAGLGCGPTSP